MIRGKICRMKLHTCRRSQKEIHISTQVWFQDENGLRSAEFKQWPSGQVGDKFSPIFRSLRIKFYEKEELKENPIYSFNFAINTKHQSLVCNTSKSFLKHIMPPQRVGFLGLFGLKTLCTFWSRIGYGFWGNYRSVHVSFQFQMNKNKIQKCVDSKCIWRIHVFVYTLIW